MKNLVKIIRFIDEQFIQSNNFYPNEKYTNKLKLLKIELEEILEDE